MDENISSQIITKEILKKKFNLFSNIFSYEEYNIDFLDYLKEIEKPSNNVCAKIFEAEEKAVRCEECALLDSSIICLECYEKSKEFHKSHNIIYEIDVEGGCCDCGNPEVWKKETFCPSHKGSFLNDEEINNFIKNNFNDDIIEKIKKWWNDLMNLLIPYFLEMEKNDDIINNKNLNEIFKIFLEFLSDIFKSNSALIQLFFQEFIKNYPYETNHNCIIINEKNDVKILYSNGQKHLCQCSFLKILLSFWSDKIAKEDFLFFFLQNNKMKIYLGLIYIAIYEKILNNNSVDLTNFNSQIYNSDIVLNSIKDPFLMLNIVQCFYNYLKKCILKNELDEIIEDNIRTFYHDIHCLLTQQTINLFSDNIELFDNYLNMIELLNNINSLEICHYYKKEGFSGNLFTCEYTLLDLFIYLISFFNFDNIELTKKLFKIYK